MKKLRQLRQTRLLLDAFLNLEKDICLPIIKLRHLIIFIDCSRECFLVSLPPPAQVMPGPLLGFVMLDSAVDDVECLWPNVGFF